MKIPLNDTVTASRRWTKLVSFFIIPLAFIVASMNVQAQCSGYLAGPANICPGGTATLTFQGGTPGANFQLYKNGSVIGSTFTGNGGVTQWSVGTGSYYVRGVSCNFQSNTVSIGAGAASYITILTNRSPFLCVGESITLTPDHGSNFSWSGPGVSGSGAVTVSPTTTTTYTLYGTEPVCYSSTSTTITVNVSPAVSQISAPAGGEATICQGVQSTTTYYASASSNVGSYGWQLRDPVTGGASNAGSVSFTVSNGVSYGTVTWNPAFEGTVTVRAIAYSSGGCTAFTSADKNVIVARRPGPPVVSDVNALYGSTFSLQASGALPSESYRWYDEQGNLVSNLVETLNFTNTSKTYYVSKYSTIKSTCETPTDQRPSQTVSLSLDVPVLTNISPNDCGPRTATFSPAPPQVTYYWQSKSSTSLSTALPVNGSYTFSEVGPYYIRAKANTLPLWSDVREISASASAIDAVDLSVSSYDKANPLIQATNSIRILPGVTVTSGSILHGRIAISPECNDQVNWKESTVLSESGTAISAARLYYDGLGNGLLNESKDYLSKKVFASQPLHNTYGDPVAGTLAAPILEPEFIFKKNFVRNENGDVYSSADFDLRTSGNAPGEINHPKPVGDQPGTLGWYYSSSNTLEPLTPVTDYPYARSFVPEGPDPTSSTSAGVGDNFKMGNGHEVRSERALRPASDISHYFTLRNTHFVPGSAIATSTSLYRIIQTDPDGKMSATFVDVEGKTLVTAKATLANGVYTYDYYSYTFYNDLGQVIATVAPKGVNTSDLTFPRFAKVFEYDHLGRLIRTTSREEGAALFVYSTDGKIRFSQNQQQLSEHRFSYTNYDYLGRIVESGEYLSTSGGYSFQPSTVEPSGPMSVLHLVDINIPQGYDIDDINPSTPASVFKGVSAKLDQPRCTDYTFVKYDLPSANAPEPQENLNGQISKTENENTITWYSYDEFGQLTKTWQKIINPLVASPEVIKTIDYSYDYFGNVTEVAYQKSVSEDRFYHHYGYDLNNRLTEVYTSKDGTTRTLHAQYQYYLHGPLKRVVLGNNLQGIDYTYTIDGALKTINHADPALDPGGDGAADVFGETLHYFDGDYQGAGYTAGTQNITGFNNQYGGLLKATSWHSPAGNHSKETYAYQYNDRNFLTNAVWGPMTGSAGAYGFSQHPDYREAANSYDKNGNIITLTRKGKGNTSLADYSYFYEANTNKLDKVNDGASQLVDYTYDAIGRVIQINEGPSKIFNLKYNAYGLVREITNGNNEIVQVYRYDDRGNLLQKVLYDAGTPQMYTTYVSDASGNTLAIYQQSGTTAMAAQPLEVPVYGAGRIAVHKPSNRYFYEIGDHLGNVRAVIGSPEMMEYPTNFETPANSVFQNYTSHDDDLMDNTDAGSEYTFSQLLNGGYNGQIGLAKSLDVSPGDVIKVEAYAKFRNPTDDDVNLNSFASALTAAFGLSAPAPGDPGLAYNALEDYGTLIAGGFDHSEVAVAPKAYINVILFDKNYNLVDAAYKQISASAEQVGTETKTPHDYLMREITVEEAGYAYIFLSNENLKQVDVHFDDVKITHTQSPIVAGADYYPFGLVIENRQITDEPYRYGYQGQFSEKNDSTGWNEFDLRFYDAKIGRWLNPDPHGQYYSPYMAMGNVPNLSIDVDGGFATDPVAKTMGMWRVSVAIHDAAHAAMAAKLLSTVVIHAEQGLTFSQKAAGILGSVGSSFVRTQVVKDAVMNENLINRPRFEAKYSEDFFKNREELIQDRETFLDRWSESTNLGWSFTYGMVDGVAVSLQNLIGPVIIPRHINGRPAGSRDRVIAFTSTASMFVPAKVFPKADAASFSSFFKGTFAARLQPAFRGFLIINFNWFLRVSAPGAGKMVGSQGKKLIEE